MKADSLQYILMISADVRVGTNALAVQLVLLLGAHHFKVEHLIERAQHSGVEPELEGHLSIRRYNPAKMCQPSENNKIRMTTSFISGLYMIG